MLSTFRIAIYQTWELHFMHHLIVCVSAALHCRSHLPRLFQPSFMTQLAVCSRYELDLRGMGSNLNKLRQDLRDGKFANISAAQCFPNWEACAGDFVSVRATGVAADSNLLNLPPGFCEDECLSDPSCYKPVLDEFLVGFASGDAAQEYMLADGVRGTVAAAIVFPEAVDVQDPISQDFVFGAC